MSVLENWNMRQYDRYLEQYARGEHDHDCEQRERSGICHCRKRRRLAAGRTEPPTLSFHYPTCDACDQEVDGDGDRFWCERCDVSWPTSASEGTPGEWQDDYGPELFGGEQFGERLIVLATNKGSV